MKDKQKLREEDSKEGSSRMKAEKEQKYRLKTGHWWLLGCYSDPQKGGSLKITLKRLVSKRYIEKRLGEG